MGPILVDYISCRAGGAGPYAPFFLEQTCPAHLVDMPSSKWFRTSTRPVVSSVDMFLRVCVCMSFHLHSPPYVCSSICMSLRVYDPSCALPFRMHVPSMYVPSIYVLSVCMSLHVYVPSACISPLCVCSLHVYVPSVYVPSVYVPSVYVPSVCIFLRLVIPSCVCCLYVYVPPWVRHSVSMFLPCPLCVLSFFMCVLSYNCCWNSQQAGRQVSGIHKLKSVPTLVRSLGCVQWGTEAHVS